jgi:predicted RNase H-like HicB family nuclease
MSFLKMMLGRLRRSPRFEDYTIKTGYTRAAHAPYASLEEFFGLVTAGATHEEAIEKLRKEFASRIAYMRRQGEPIPRPGSGRAEPKFAPNDQIEALRPFVDGFWSDILGTSYAMSFVSNESRLDSWEDYVPGGRAALVQRVVKRYGVDISAYCDEPIPQVLRRIKQESNAAM